MNIRRTNTILYSDRWSEMVAFYRDLLEFPVEFANDWFVEFVVGHGAYVSVADAARSTIRPGGGAGITLSWQVDDVHTTRSDLVRVGIPVGEVGRRWDAEVLDVRDPAGNRIEFWSVTDPTSTTDP